jgi:hypothetical protein
MSQDEPEPEERGRDERVQPLEGIRLGYTVVRCEVRVQQVVGREVQRGEVDRHAFLLHAGPPAVLRLRLQLLLTHGRRVLLAQGIPDRDGPDLLDDERGR